MADHFATAVYAMCFLTSAACAALLARSFKAAGSRLLLWSAICFVFLALNNLVVIVDMLLLPEADLRAVRYMLSLAAIGILLFGFIWDLEE